MSVCVARGTGGRGERVAGSMEWVVLGVDVRAPLMMLEKVVKVIVIMKVIEVCCLQ